MRPHRLTLKGFTCFREESTIDFENMQVFAIVGRTGSGKTTLMDAICYALYGRVPRGTDAGRLVARGADKMYVSFEFDASSGRYRAVRSVNVSAKGNQTPHVLFERQVAGDEWEPLEDRARAMNEHIERVVGLDFKAFERCVLLPQGRFQEMLTGDPQERRRVLEELLDIGIYERIMKRANAARTGLNAECAAIEKVLATTYADTTEEALQRNKRDLAETKPELKKAQQSRDAISGAIEHTATLRQARADEREAAQALDAAQKEVAAAEGLAAQGESQAEELGHQVDKSRLALQDVGYDRARHMALTGAREIALHLLSLRERAAGAASRAADRTALAQAERIAQEAVGGAAAAALARQAAEEAVESAARADAAASLRAGLREGDPCPVCGGPVGKTRAAPPPGLKKAQEALKRARSDEAKASDAASSAQKALERASAAQEHAEEEAAHLGKELAATGKRLEEQLPEGVAADPAAIEALCADLAARGVEFDRLSAELAELTERKSSHERAMAAARDQLAGLRAQVQQLTAAASEHRKRGDEAIGALRKVVDRWSWGDVAGAIDAKKDPRPLLDAMRVAADDECGRLDRAIATLEERIKSIAAQIEDAKQQRAALEAKRERAALFGTIGDLLQANRFRDWYISTAMVMLADAASRRLEVLDSDRRYALGVANSEFIVIDGWEGGEVRSPDTLSGGETFVVSLALALALAEQLPQIQASAGTALESLFLDEGFGTLDADTLDPVVNALQGLGAEGRTVGIITHVGELAERIGTRIEVTKSPSGSSVTVAGG